MDNVKTLSSSTATIKVIIWNSYLQASELFKSYLMVSNQITWRIVKVSYTASESCAVLTLNLKAGKQIAVLLDLCCPKAETLKENFITISSSYRWLVMIKPEHLIGSLCLNKEKLGYSPLRHLIPSQDFSWNVQFVGRILSQSVLAVHLMFLKLVEQWT